MKCIKCHKPLKTLSSKQRGMGPVCWSRFQNEIGNQPEGKSHVTTGHAQIGENIILSRDTQGRPTVNVIQQTTYHSPDGFEWGYGGSGPSDLALNILLIYLDWNDAWTLHHDFKYRFISNVPFHGTVIGGQEIIDYLNNNIKKLFDDQDNQPKYKRISGQAEDR